MESRMAAIRDEITQQSGTIDLRASVSNAQRCNVGLSSDRTHGAKKIRRECLFHLWVGCTQGGEIDFVSRTIDRQRVEAFAVQLGNAFVVECDGVFERH